MGTAAGGGPVFPEKAVLTAQLSQPLAMKGGTVTFEGVDQRLWEAPPGPHVLQGMAFGSHGGRGQDGAGVCVDVRTPREPNSVGLREGRLLCFMSRRVLPWPHRLPPAHRPPAGETQAGPRLTLS